MKNIDFFNKTVILRTDYNVPVKNGKITSAIRIDASLKTIRHILTGSPKRLIIISHMGRPNGEDLELSLRPVKKYLQNIFQESIFFGSLDAYLSTPFERISEKIVLLENIRFYPEETKNIETTANFRERLSSLGDIYINDAFGCSHRAHSSIIGINTPEKCNGFLVESERTYLEYIFNNRGKKTLILGGSKISDKIQLINNLIPKVDNILIGGGMAFTFLKYFGTKIGSSLFDESGFNLVTEILQNAIKHNTVITLPTDFVCNDIFQDYGNIIYSDSSVGIPDNHMGLDIGKNTISEFKEVLSKSEYIIWNGPVGVFELENFSEGCRQLMRYISTLPATTIIGGGDTAACCEKFNCSKKVTHISTGGGASLELLEGKNLPGLM